jgi:predicted ATP-dependent endonuclease of OLD family
VLLADEGLGITKLIGIMMNIEIAILSAKRNHLYGYGVLIDKKQRYPKIAREITSIAIEEPENHLHPRYQALLAEMFVDAYKNYHIHFIVETHSEYMVRKLQTLVAKKDLTPAEVSLQYLYSPDVEQRPKGEPQVKTQ